MGDQAPPSWFCQPDRSAPAGSVCTTARAGVFLPGHVGELLGQLEGLGLGLGHAEFGVFFFGRLRSRGGHVALPGGNAGLKAVLLGGLLVARLHVEEREVGVHQLLVGFELLGAMSLGDGRGVVAQSIMAHGQAQTCIEVIGILRQDPLEFRNGDRVLAGRVVEHGIIKLILVAGHRVVRTHW